MASSITLPDFEFLNAPSAEYNEDDGYEDGEGDEDYDEEEYVDAEAEEMARRLGDQLLADIAKAQAEAAAVAGTANGPPAPSEGPSQGTYRKKQDAAVLTMKAILAFAARNPVVHSAMSTSHVPGAGGASLLEVFNRCISASSISKPLARTLTEIVLSVASATYERLSYTR
ncbi:hypothetical protein C2E23DRAFT_857369 [Lenzites betulinus]|nr:hypothetical protein C2E23DRAFT_857369 [Lenzites betulinus]